MRLSTKGSYCLEVWERTAITNTESFQLGFWGAEKSFSQVGLFLVIFLRLSACGFQAVAAAAAAFPLVVFFNPAI